MELAKLVKNFCSNLNEMKQWLVLGREQIDRSGQREDFQGEAW